MIKKDNFFKNFFISSKIYNQNIKKTKNIFFSFKEDFKNGEMPFLEENGPKLLKKLLKKNKIYATYQLSHILKSKYIIICIGTPINKQLNPSLRNFTNFFYQLKKLLNKDQIVIIRSSIYPGICDKIYKIIRRT